MGKSLRQRLADEHAAREHHELASGKRWRVLWTHGTGRYGPLYFASEDAAVAKTQEMVAKNERPIPPDYYERQATLNQMTVWIESFDGRAWGRHGAEKTVVVGVHYADG